MPESFRHSESAVSEVVDFVTILGILVLSIGLIGVAGYPLLKNIQDAKHIENTKQSFIVLAMNVNKVVMGQSPSQSVELKLYGGTLSVTGTSTINITAKNSSDQTITLADQQIRSIESSVGDTVVAYEGTGVWAKYPNGNTLVVYRPLITNQSKILVIPVVTITGASSIGGSGLSRVTVQGVSSVSYYGNMHDIRITVNSSYSDGWQKYFTSVMDWSVCSSNECTAKLSTPDNIDVYILNIQLDSEVG